MTRRALLQVAAVAALAALARGLMTGGLELYSDEAYYWLWSRRLAAGYFDHPPMVAWLAALGTSFSGTEAWLRLPFVICGGLAVLFAGLCAGELSDDPRAPAWGALLAAAAPLLSLTGALCLPDAPAEAAYAAAGWLLARARGRSWLWAGLAVGLALLSKYTAALLAPALVLLVPWDPELRRELRRPWPWLGGALAVALFLPVLRWNAAHGWDSLRFQLHHGFGHGASVRSFGEYVGGQLVGAGPVALALGIAFLVRARTSAQKRLAAAALLPLLVTTWSALRGPVEVNWPSLAYPLLCAAAGAGLCELREPLARRLLALSLALGLVLVAAFGKEERRPVLLAGTAAAERFHGWRAFAAEARAAAARACAEVGCDAAAPFVYASSYQLAGELAFYAGWRRLGLTAERPSQLDVWGDAPRPGEPFLVLDDGEVPAAFRARVRAEGEGRTHRFLAPWPGAARKGSVTGFGRYLGPR
ncbi:MAG TPA: glycosyltransferase family 39 protein [Anaeromyxobacteraceae bacterium]|nr:glycosyltransferase family 39 protein [Anaeromyxobacteraceae bacterium]